jgi:hypothetical protein
MTEDAVTKNDPLLANGALFKVSEAKMYPVLGVAITVSSIFKSTEAPFAIGVVPCRTCKVPFTGLFHEITALPFCSICKYL